MIANPACASGTPDCLARYAQVPALHAPAGGVTFGAARDTHAPFDGGMLRIPSSGHAAPDLPVPHSPPPSLPYPTDPPYPPYPPLKDSA